MLVTQSQRRKNWLMGHFMGISSTCSTHNTSPSATLRAWSGALLSLGAKIGVPLLARYRTTGRISALRAAEPRVPTRR